MGGHFKTVWLTVSLLPLMALVSCTDGDDSTSAPRTAPQATLFATQERMATTATELPPRLLVRDEDFVESEDARDPFRSFAHLAPKIIVEPPNQPAGLKAPSYSLSQLRLVGIVSGAERRALLTDHEGFGWLLAVGQHVGKAELVASSSSDRHVGMYWRVARIRSTDVVFIRETAAHPDLPATTRIVHLHPES